MNAKRQARDVSGFISVEYMVAVAISFFVLVFLTNFIVIQYGQGVVRAAADDGARAGSRVQAAASSISICQQRSETALQGILQMLSAHTVNCALVGDRVQATVTASFEPWVPGVPAVTENATAYSVRESATAP